MNRDRLVADRLYFIVKGKQYFYTPDGVGGYWYDNSDEVIDAGFGDYPLHVIETLSDF